jgi:hypothetical protein
MIPSNTQIWLIAGITDMRLGHTSLCGLVSELGKYQALNDAHIERAGED